MPEINLFFVKIYFRDRFILFSGLLTIFFLAITWWYVVANLKPEAAQIILHYTVVLGPNLSGQWWQILYLPLVGTIVGIFNYAVALVLYARDKTAARILALSTPVFEFALGVGLWFIIGIN